MKESAREGGGEAIALPTQRTCPLDPPPEYRRLREEQPVVRLAFPDGPPGWLVTRYEDVRACLADPRLSSRRPHLNAHLRESLISAEEMAALRSPNMLNTDPPEHTRLRQPLTGQFSVRRVRALEPHIERLVDVHLDAMEAATERRADLVQALALAVPLLVICELLGVPYEDQAFFRQVTSDLLRLDIGRDSLLASKKALRDYLRALVKAKRLNPEGDLLSGLTQAETVGAPLSDDEIASLGQLMLIAGHETTANMIGLGTLTLLRTPGAWARLRAHPERVEAAVEELLRYLTILQFGLLRVSTEQLTLGGQTIEAGERVVLHLASANRDPAQFAAPDDLVLDRAENRHLTFGHGVHQCIGQQLARVEMRIVFSKLVARFPDLRLAIPAEQVTTRDNMVIYGVQALQVAWGPIDGG